MQGNLLLEPQGLLFRLLSRRASLAKVFGTGLLLLGSLGAQAQLSGARAIPGSGSTGYASLAAAITDLNAQGVGPGGVTFNIAAGYTETFASPTAGAITASGTAANPIVFQKAGTGANPTITAGIGASPTLDAIISLAGSDYVTFDGLTLVDPTSNTGTNPQMEWGFAVLKAGSPAVDGAQNVTIRNCTITLQKGIVTSGIYLNNHTPTAISQLTPTTAAGTNSNNKFYGNTISGVNNGIYLAGYLASSPYALYDQNNEVGSIVSGTAATGNTVSNFGTTATAYGIYAIYQNGLKVQGNNLDSTPTGSAAASTSTLYGVLVSTGGSADLLGNTVNLVSNVVSTGFTTIYGIQNGSGANTTNGTVTIANNSVTMSSATASVATFYGIYNTAAVTNLTISGNTLSGWSRPTATTGSTYFVYVGTGATATVNVFGNTISNYSGTATTAGVYGFYGFHNSNSAAQYYDNTMQNINGGGNNLWGTNLFGSSTLDVYRNRISGLTALGTSPIVYGIYASGATTNVTNNLVGDINAPAASSVTAISGLFLGGTVVNAQYNSIYLNATSTGTNFGTSGITYNSLNTSPITLRNNVVVNTSTANGTGVTAALRRTAGTAGVVPVNLTTTTNANLYYAGTPSATNLIYVEGQSVPYVNAQQTLTDYKNFMAGREANSVTENPPFVSTSGTNANFLRVSTTTPTQIESGGVPINGITTDYANATRSTTAPDLGAYEGTYQPLDLTGPTLTYAPLNNTNSTAGPALVVTISDPSGVATGANAPRLYYRKGTTGAFVFVNATSVSGNSYTFNFNYALLPGGVTTGDVIQYYVSAQDLVASPNASTSPGGGGGTTPPGTTAPASPASFQIVGTLSGAYYVGTSTPPAGTPANRMFATLTAAANAYAINVLTGPTTFYLLDAAYSGTTGETFPITFSNIPSASATNTLTVSPYTGVSATVTGPSTAAAVVLFNNARYITLDGANTAGGSTRNLTLNSTNVAANAVVWVGSQGANAGSTNITLRNLNLVGSSSSSSNSFSNSNSFGIYVSAGLSVSLPTPSSFIYGDDNDNLVIQNNAITATYDAIFAKANGVPTSYDGLQIVGNRIGAVPSGTSTAAFGNVLFRGIDLQGATAPLISRNTILGIDGSAAAFNIAGIELGANVTNGVISRNAISGLRQQISSGYGAYGIFLSSTTNLTNTEISNNLISDILTGAYSSSSIYNPFGIYMTGGTGTKLYYNTVNLFGTFSPNASYATPSNISAALAVTSASVTGLDVRNNIFANTIASAATTNTVKSYSVYYTNASVLGTSDYNDYYVAAPNGVLGYVAADVATLAALKTATTKDVNSISADPVFTSNTNLLPVSPAVAAAGTPLTVTVDYTGATRPATTPSLGAYQFTPAVTDLAPGRLVSPLNNNTATCFGANTPVTVLIRNNGSAALDFATTPATVTVVISGPSSSTQTLTQTINTGTLASTATQNVTLTSLADFTALGTYSFAITATVQGDGNTTNDLLTPAPTLNVLAPVGGTLSPATSSICVSGTASLSLAGPANGSIQLQSSNSATGTFTDVAGATATTYTTPVLTSTTYYRYKVTCGANVAYSNVATVTVNNPVISAAPSPLSVCAGGTASLSATVPTGISVRYFTTATGGTAVGTGNPYVTAPLTASTTYYAEAFASGAERVGKATSVQTNGGYSGTNTGIVLTTNGPTTIQEATVYNATATAGSLTVELRDNVTGTLVATAGPFAVAAGSTSSLIPTVLPLNLAVPAAGTYRLVTATTGTPPTLYRDNVNSFPYTTPSGSVSIIGGYIGGASSSYYFFFNLLVGNDCVSTSRTPIQVNVTPGLVAMLGAATASSCGSTPYQLNGTVAGTATGGTYTSSGTGTFSPNATTLNTTYTPSAADVAAGTVTLTLTPTGPSAACTQTAQTVLSLSTPPNASFSYPAGTYCTNSPVTVTPVLAPGAVAGTFATTAPGLRIDPATGVITLATTNIDGTFTITNTVAGTGACSAGSSATTTFTVIFGIGQPTLTATPQAGGAVVLSTPATAGVTYQFYRSTGGGAPVAVGTPTATGTLQLTAGAQSGSYTVVAISSAGCSSIPSAAVTATVLGTGTATLAGVSLRVFPNPTADGQLSVELSGINAKASQLTVLNALGQVVHTGTVAAGTAQLQLSQLAAGVYTFRVLTAQGVLTQRVVRQ
ncbi:T9SS type A sorting domain-containing protein [Hymenobacter properus]|uniref:T9SS type A sorting domain-containing protein n=1 Tax=Hymenobacter properus TaxID=2791026 RepID=A0A931BIR3_9BACT|nr:T9SS type A sorting domain-containing protein [Hymenobacter properus]MBF9143256.1 T9SS type A sorting domain-containing protein [Hymenobacter properus]MBR7722066.1 T9SS type A sorting domain-containing protein [Microvirga sp. SRT04]